MRNLDILAAENGEHMHKVATLQQSMFIIYRMAL